MATPSQDLLPQPASRSASSVRARLGPPLRRIGRILQIIAILLAGLIVGVICFALFPPADLLRRAGVVIARQVLNHPNLDIAALDIVPLRHLELRGLWLGPPAGYRWPLFTLKRISARWDIGRIARRELRLLHLQVERPLLRVEERHGKLSWLAFIEGLPKSKPKPEEPPSEPPDLRVFIDRVSVIGVGALVDDGKERLLLDGLQVGAAGLYSKKRTHLDVTVRLEERRPGQPNLALLLPAAPGQKRMGGRFRLGLGLEVAVEGLETPRADLRLQTSLSTAEIRAPWKLAPLSIDLAVAAGADLAKKRADLEELRLKFNGSELLAVRGDLRGLQPPRQFDVHLQNLRVPLDELAPYVRAVVPDLEVGGEIVVRDLTPSGDLQSILKLLSSLEARTPEKLSLAGLLEELKKHVPPRITGIIEASKVRAHLKAAKPSKRVDVGGIDFRVAFASMSRPAPATPERPEALSAALPALVTEPTPSATAQLPLLLQSRFHIGSVRAAGAELRGLELRFAAGVDLDGAQPRAFASHVSLDLPKVRYRNPRLGAMELGVKTRLRVSGDLLRSRINLERLELGLSDWLRARVSGSLSDFKRKLLSADVVVEPFRVERALAQLPAPIRSSLGRMRVAGSIGLQAKVKGRAPAPRTPPLRLPFDLDARVSLGNLRLDDPDHQLFLEKLGGELRAKGRPSDLRVTSSLHVGSLRKPDQRLSVRDVSLPLEARLLPTGVEAKVGVKLGSVRQGSQLASEKTGLSLDVRAAVPVERAMAGKPFAPGPVNVLVGLRSSKLGLRQPGNTLAVHGLKADVKLGYQPSQKEVTSLSVDLGAVAVRHAEQGASLDQVALKLRTGLGGPRLKVPLPFAPGELTPRALLALLQGVQTGVELRIGRVGLRGLPGQALRDNRLELQAKVGADQSLTLRKLSLRVPGRGLRVDLSGRVNEVLAAGLGPLPPFDLQLKVALDNPVTHDSKRALVVAPNLKVAGRVGFEARVRRLSKNRVKLDGTLLARRFNLWTRNVSVQEEEKNLLRRTQTIHVRDMDAEVPLSQEIIVKLPAVKLPSPRRSILEGGAAASALYTALQPYRGSRSRLRIGGITLDELHTATTREGYFISTVPRHYKVDRVALDLGVADSTLQLSRLYLKLFGGDITGEVQAQVVRLRPLDVRLRLRTQVTGVNLAYLDPAAKEKTAKTEVSALVDMKYWMSRQLVEGRVNITRLSLDMLDSLLAYLDPNKTNESVQKNRKLINAWYVKKLNPRVKLVSVWIAYGNLNMDIDMDAWFVAGTLIKSTLKNNRIRRLNILPFLPKVAGTVEEE